MAIFRLKIFLFSAVLALLLGNLPIFLVFALKYTPQMGLINFTKLKKNTGV